MLDHQPFDATSKRVPLMISKSDCVGYFHNVHSAMRYLLDRMDRAHRSIALPLLETYAVENDPTLVLPIVAAPPLELLPGVSENSFRTLAEYRAYGRANQQYGAAINLLPFPGIVHDGKSQQITTLTANVERIGHADSLPPSDAPPKRAAKRARTSITE